MTKASATSLLKPSTKKVKKKQFQQTKFNHKIKCPDCLVAFNNTEFERHKPIHSVLYTNLSDGIHISKKPIVEHINDLLGSPSEEFDKVFVKVCSKKIIAVVVVKETQTSFRLLNPTTISQIEVNSILGISRIWTHPGHRKKGIAREMLDYIRKEYVFGMVIDKEQLSFSQPSGSGYALGCSYFGRPDFPVYL